MSGISSGRTGYPSEGAGLRARVLEGPCSGVPSRAGEQDGRRGWLPEKMQFRSTSSTRGEEEPAVPSSSQYQWLALPQYPM
jgi:hypothetical protein